jgi:hypothetical protein
LASQLTRSIPRRTRTHRKPPGSEDITCSSLRLFFFFNYSPPKAIDDLPAAALVSAEHAPSPFSVILQLLPVAMHAWLIGGRSFVDDIWRSPGLWLYMEWLLSPSVLGLGHACMFQFLQSFLPLLCWLFRLPCFVFFFACALQYSLCYFWRRVNGLNNVTKI